MRRRAELSSPQRSAGRRTARSCSLHWLVSPWIRAAIAHGLCGWSAWEETVRGRLQENLSMKNLLVDGI